MQLAIAASISTGKVVTLSDCCNELWRKDSVDPCHFSAQSAVSAGKHAEISAGWSFESIMYTRLVQTWGICVDIKMYMTFKFWKA